MGPKRTPPIRRGGITVSTVRRVGAGSSASTSDRPLESDGQGGKKPFQRRGVSGKSKASKRYREKAVGASRPGENFFKDSLVASQFEERVLDIYAPTPDLNESVQSLPLRVQARREGIKFQLPRLSDICLGVVSDHFGTKVLPLLQKEEQQEQNSNQPSFAIATSHRKRKRKGILGFMVEEDDDDEEDYIPNGTDEEAPPPNSMKKRRLMGKGKKKEKGKTYSENDIELLEFIHERNSYLLMILPSALSMALQVLLERKGPQILTFHVLGKYFLSRAKVTATKSFRALGMVGGTNARGIATLLRGLYSIPRSGLDTNPASGLRLLHLQAHTRLSTSQLLPLFKQTTQLEEVCLRGCISVTSEAINQLVTSSGQKLRAVNLNWTGVGLEGVEEVIRGCPNIEVLKVAHVRGLTDSLVPTMMERITRATIIKGIVPLSKLQKLKLHGTEVGNVGLGSILKHCGSKLVVLDIANTHVGGMGCSQFLLLLLGLTYGPSPFNFRGNNSTLCKLNLSGLSLPDREVAMLATHIGMFTALTNFTFNGIRSHNQGGGQYDLGEGIDSEELALLVSALAMHARSGRGEVPATQKIVQAEANSPKPYHFEKLAIANKVIGRLDLSSLLQASTSDVKEESAWFAVKHLDLSGLDLTTSCTHSTDWLGCQSLSLGDCNLVEDPDWESLGASGLLRRIDLSRTRVSEAAVERLVAMNPYLTSINLTGCRGIPVTRRRNFFLQKGKEEA